MTSKKKIIKARVDPRLIAEDFLIREFIKLFPEETPDFYDRIRFHLREFRQRQPDSHFWRLLAGYSDVYMLKNIYQLLKGDRYSWSLEQIPLEGLCLQHLGKKWEKILAGTNLNAGVVGKKLRQLTVEEREQILDPFEFSRDSYPVIAYEEDGKLIVYDGNRRTLNMAALGFEKVDAYVGRIANPNGKQAIFFSPIAEMTKLWVNDKKGRGKELLEAIEIIMGAFAETYSNGQEEVLSEINTWTQKDDPELQEAAKRLYEALWKKRCL